MQAELSYQRSPDYVLSRLRHAREHISYVLPHLDGKLYEELSRALVIINRVYDRILDAYVD